MIKKLKAFFSNSYWFQQNTLNHLYELEWANIFHDSIRGIKYLENLSLNIGRWAGNYSFFYVLHRILKDAQPTNILELGLGESSKFISTYLDNHLLNSFHTVIEQDIFWIKHFKKDYNLSERTQIHHFPIVEQKFKNVKVTVYENLIKKFDKKFDLYLIDGPIGTDKYSRFDILNLVNHFNPNDEFIIFLDDFHRKGEQETGKQLLKLLKDKQIQVNHTIFRGNKQQLLITTKKYKFLNTI